MEMPLWRECFKFMKRYIPVQTWGEYTALVRTYFSKHVVNTLNLIHCDNDKPSNSSYKKNSHSSFSLAFSFGCFTSPGDQFLFKYLNTYVTVVFIKMFICATEYSPPLIFSHVFLFQERMVTTSDFCCQAPTLWQHQPQATSPPPALSQWDQLRPYMYVSSECL